MIAGRIRDDPTQRPGRALHPTVSDPPQAKGATPGSSLRAPEIAGRGNNPTQAARGEGIRVKAEPQLYWRRGDPAVPRTEVAVRQVQARRGDGMSPSQQGSAQGNVGRPRLPSRNLAEEPGMTAYRVFSGEGAILDPDTPDPDCPGDRRADEQLHGRRARRGRSPWTKPDDLPIGNARGLPAQLPCSARPAPDTRGGFNALFGDGSVRVHQAIDQPPDDSRADHTVRRRDHRPRRPVAPPTVARQFAPDRCEVGNDLHALFRTSVVERRPPGGISRVQLGTRLDQQLKHRRGRIPLGADSGEVSARLRRKRSGRPHSARATSRL